MTLMQATPGRVYIVRSVETGEAELDAFLFSLGCYSGEPITVISRRRGGMTLAIKDGRYNIDDLLAARIYIQE